MSTLGKLICLTGARSRFNSAHTLNRCRIVQAHALKLNCSFKALCRDTIQSIICAILPWPGERAAKWHSFALAL